jgi:hypothetical protein
MTARENLLLVGNQEVPIRANAASAMLATQAIVGVVVPNKKV